MAINSKPVGNPNVQPYIESEPSYRPPIRRHSPEQILRKLDYHKRLYEHFLKEAQEWLTTVEDLREQVYEAINKK